jgi:chromosome segregation ATPase
MNKEEFKAKANQTIDEISAKINEMKAKRASVKEDLKVDYDKAIKELESKKADMEVKYADLKDAAEEKWDEAKVAFSAASDSVKEGLNKLKSMF